MVFKINVFVFRNWNQYALRHFITSFTITERNGCSKDYKKGEKEPKVINYLVSMVDQLLGSLRGSCNLKKSKSGLLTLLFKNDLKPHILKNRQKCLKTSILKFSSLLSRVSIWTQVNLKHINNGFLNIPLNLVVSGIGSRVRCYLYYPHQKL